MSKISPPVVLLTTVRNTKNFENMARNAHKNFSSPADVFRNVLKNFRNAHKTFRARPGVRNARKKYSQNAPQGPKMG